MSIFLRDLTHCKIFFRLINLMRKVLCNDRFCLLIMTEAVAQRCSVKKVFLENSQNSHENTCFTVSLLISWTCIFIEKEILTKVFSCEFCEIAKNTFSYRTPPVAASVMRFVYETGETLPLKTKIVLFFYKSIFNY